MAYNQNVKDEKMTPRKANPYNKREAKNDTKAQKHTNKTVKPVAKDTNKTRRKSKKPTKGNIDG